MTPHLIARLVPLAVFAALPACSSPPSEQTGDKAATADKAAGLAIESVAAREVDNVPLGSVPGTISLPPEARVAVTAPFAGAVVRVYVIEGQQVARGEALGLVRATEPVAIGGDLARARSAAALAEARAKRLSQLADEGVIARARADEARAELEQARASVAQFARMAALGGVGPDGTMTLFDEKGSGASSPPTSSRVEVSVAASVVMSNMGYLRQGVRDQGARTSTMPTPAELVVSSRVTVAVVI